MIDNLINWISELASNIFSSEEILSTLIAVVVILLKLFINNKATKLQRKALFVSLPGEIEILAVGFIISSTINVADQTVLVTRMSLVFICFIFLIIQFASERALESSLSGQWHFGTLFAVSLLYAIAIAMFYLVVFGGIL